MMDNKSKSLGKLSVITNHSAAAFLTVITQSISTKFGMSH